MSKYNKEDYREWYLKNSEKKKEYTKKYYQNNREKCIKNNIEYRKRKPEVTLKTMLKVHYNLTIEEYCNILNCQNNNCKICNITLDRTNKLKTPHVDHNHKTGKVRGILCHQCNLDLGKIEKEGFLEKALNYLKEYE